MKNLKWIVRLEGGLGNQLFQYAHLRALQHKYGGELYFDTHAYNGKQIRQLSLNHLCIPTIPNANDLGICDKFCLFIKKVLHKSYMRKWLADPSSIDQKKYEILAEFGLYLQYLIPMFPSFVAPKKAVNYVSGNYLTAGFFEGAEDILRKEFQVKTELSGKSKEMLRQIESCNSVCMHVRLGDYLAPEWKDKLYICTPEYYKEALELIKTKVEKPVFFIFSNRHKDIEWIKENIHLDAEVVYVDLSNPDYEDFKLMYSCKHFIMSNSTYSWWAQWLGSAEDKVVVAPSRFNNYPRWDMSGIYMDSWNLIKV